MTTDQHTKGDTNLLEDAHDDDVIGGRYVLLEVLGSGGMARVFRAHDTRLGRDVALKLLHPHLAEDPTFRRRIQREARSAAALTHPNVVAVHDVGEDDRDAWIVMEMVLGDTLRDVLSTRGRLSPAEALALLQPVAIGLGAAHARGLVHRDVKPENVLLARDGQIKVSDFGLARASADPSLTLATSVIVGSPHYLAPEVVHADTCDARTDVYSLGVVLYESLTGRPPFEAETALATALRHTTDRVPRPSLSVPGLSSALDALVLRATDPDPDERQANAQVFADELAAAVPEGPVIVDLRDGERMTVVIPLSAADTQVTTRAGGLPDDVSKRKRRKLERAQEQAAAKAMKAGAQPRRRKRRGRRALVALVLLALVGAGGFVAWDQVVSPVVALPVTVGDDGATAVPALREAGFDVRIDSEHPYDRDVAAGDVLRISPPSGARRGSTIVLTLSAGPQQKAIPTVTGDSLDVAAATLGEAGFLINVEEIHDALDAGLVVSTNPAAGTVTNDGATIDVFLSLGREPTVVPDLSGLGEAEAIAALTEAGLEGAVVGRSFDEEVPAGEILTQSPLAESEGLVGDEVQLIVSDGPAPFEMTDHSGQRAATAQQELEGLGLVVEIELIDTQFSDRRGRVDSHTPAPGQEVRRGDTVILYVWR